LTVFDIVDTVKKDILSKRIYWVKDCYCWYSIYASKEPILHSAIAMLGMWTQNFIFMHTS